MPARPQLEPGVSASFAISLPAPPWPPHPISRSSTVPAVRRGAVVCRSRLSQAPSDDRRTAPTTPRCRPPTRQPSPAAPQPSPGAPREYPMSEHDRADQRRNCGGLFLDPRPPSRSRRARCLSRTTIQSGAIALPDLRRILLDSPEFRQTRGAVSSWRTSEGGGSRGQSCRTRIRPLPRGRRRIGAAYRDGDHRAVEPGATFVDVGANVGGHVLPGGCESGGRRQSARVRAQHGQRRAVPARHRRQ